MISLQAIIFLMVTNLKTLWYTNYKYITLMEHLKAVQGFLLKCLLFTDLLITCNSSCIWFATKKKKNRYLFSIF